MLAREKCSKPQKKPCLRPIGISLNSSRMPASFSASSQAAALSFVTIGKIASRSTLRGAMGEITTERAGVAVGACSTSLATGAADVEEDADDFASKRFIDPLVVFIEDQSCRRSLVIFLVVSAAAKVALKGR